MLCNTNAKPLGPEILYRFSILQVGTLQCVPKTEKPQALQHRVLCQKYKLSPRIQPDRGENDVGMFSFETNAK